MAYTLQALVGEVDDVTIAAPTGACFVVLPQAKGLIPLTENVRREYGIPYLPLTGDGSEDVPRSIETLAARAKKIAYVEAEFFGGAGTQAAAVWEEGKLVFGPVIANDAINQALRLLGVSKEAHHDEFEALSLGRHRDTDKWT